MCCYFYDTSDNVVLFVIAIYLPFLLHAVSITCSFVYVPFQWELYPP